MELSNFSDFERRAARLFPLAKLYFIAFNVGKILNLIESNVFECRRYTWSFCFQRRVESSKNFSSKRIPAYLSTRVRSNKNTFHVLLGRLKRRNKFDAKVFRFIWNSSSTRIHVCRMSGVTRNICRISTRQRSCTASSLKPNSHRRSSTRKPWHLPGVNAC